MLIPVSCRTNIDNFKGLNWPKFMYNPQLGDSVQAIDGRKLNIVQITHVQLKEEDWAYSDYHKGVYLEIELHYSS